MLLDNQRIFTDRTMDILDDKDFLSHDFENMLLNPEEMQAYLKKFEETCSNFRAKLDRRILDSISKNSEYESQLEKSCETISQLSNQKKELRANLQNIKLEQKVVEKKAINIIKDIEKTKADTESAKEKVEKLSMEIVDLEQEFDKNKDYMKKQWNAVKKANNMYKNILDIHIQTEMIDHMEHVTVTFFWAENKTDKKFFVILVNQDNCWKVKKIEPELSIEDKYQLNHTVQFAKQSEVSDVRLLLCELRKLFSKIYFES